MSATDEFLRDADVTRVTGIPRSSRYRMIESGQFPKPIKLAARSVGWSAAEIEKWQRDRIAERDSKSEVA
jgi:prophage regulatory protein